MTAYLVFAVLTLWVGMLNAWLGRPFDTQFLLSGIYLICHEIARKK